MQPRNAYVSCVADASGVALAQLRHPRHVIVSRAAAFSVCPSWLLHPKPAAERGAQPDGALEERFVEPVRQGRAALIALFDEAARDYPASDWIVGQHVRLLIEQGEEDRAARAVAACHANQWWCLLLDGYVRATRGDVVGAEAQIAAALAQMPPDERCRWTDESVLLDSTGRAAYRQVPCAARDSLNAVLWWLADPLYSVPGNARLVEQYRRKVDLALRTALDRDGRYDWRPATGADARAEMFLRYGTPSLVVYAQGYSATAYLRYLLLDGDRRLSHATFEYTPGGRVHTMPAWQAVVAPTRAPREAWDIADPGDQVNVLQATSGVRGTRPEAVRAAAQVSAWWPVEHVRLVPGLVQLPEGQVAFLRRQDSVVVATATDLGPAPLGRAAGSVVAGTLLVTDRPGSQQVLARATGRVGTPLVLVGTAAPRPAVAAIEFPGDSAAGLPAGRTRVGIAPPPPLAALAPGAVALSDPVLLRPPAAEDALPVATAEVLATMAGSPTIPRGTRLGLYWETYGFAATDTVAFAVGIARATADGRLRRLGVRLNVTPDRTTPVAVAWTETAPGRNATVLAGPVPIIGRSLVLDTAALPPGTYWLELVVSRAGAAPVRARRQLVVGGA